MMSLSNDLQRRLDPHNRVERRKRSLNPAGGSVTTSIDKDWCRKTGIDLDDPRDRNQYFLQDLGVVVIDLEGKFNGDAE